MERSLVGEKCRSQPAFLMIAIPLATQLSVWGRTSSLAMPRSVARVGMLSVQQVPLLLKKEPLPFGCLLLSVRGDHGSRCDGNSCFAICEITSELWAYVGVEVAEPVLLAKSVNTRRVSFPLPPTASKFRSQKQMHSFAFNICQR